MDPTRIELVEWRFHEHLVREESSNKDSNQEVEDASTICTDSN